MTDKVYSLNEIQNSLVPILRKYGVSQAWVFGSYARHEAGSDSDVDILLKGFEGKELSLLERFTVISPQALGKRSISSMRKIFTEA